MAAAQVEFAEELEDDYEEDEMGYDELEASLVGEGGLEVRGLSKTSMTGLALSKMSVKLSHAAENDQTRAEKSANRVANHTGRDDRATSEQVLDPRTRLVLFKLLSSNYFSSIDGCVSTGKEANVYYAKAGGGEELAVKVYKTSILVFRDRERYVDGEFRFRNGYSRGKNPRKMVQLWAEKELRNYKRLQDAGVNAPKPLLLKSNVLVMQFIGHDGWPAPRLKDANLSEKRLREAYWQACRAMRVLFVRCHLVHGDLSEYNMLWHNNEIVVIDVSQSVEMDHPRASEFLKNDCKNVNDFFRRQALEPMSTADLYDFVCHGSPGFEGSDDAAIDSALTARLDVLSAAPSGPKAEKTRETTEDAVFMGAFLPRSLNELSANCERVQRELNAGHKEQAYEDAVGRMLAPSEEAIGSSSSSRADEAETVNVNNGGDTSSDHSSDDDDDFADSGDDDIDDRGETHASGRLPNDNVLDRAHAKALKKKAAKLQKESTREARKTKLKKHLKKKACKGKGNK